MQHTTLYVSLTLLCTTTTWNFQVLWRKCRMSSRSLFFSWQAATHFHLTLVAASISHFLTAVTKFSCCSSNKKNVSFVFLSLALDLCCPFSRLASLACRLLSLFLCLSLAPYSKLWTWRWIYCKLNTFKITQTQKQLPLSVFVFIDSLAFSALLDAGGYAISRQINSSCIWVAIPVDWVILHWEACGADGRVVARTGVRSRD